MALATPASTQHRDPIGTLQRLVQLVGNEDDRQPVGSQVAQTSNRPSISCGAKTRDARPE
jgi:hypothetical protein